MSEKKFFTKNMRKDVVCGLIEGEDIGTPVSVLFTEWWNGEGLDFEFERGKQGEVKFGLTITEMEHMVAAMLVSGFIDMDEVNRIVSEVKV